MSNKVNKNPISLVAVYGSLRKGLHNHRVIRDSRFVSKGMVKGFGMYSLGLYPALSRVGKKNDVVVEVYDVNSTTMERLDQLEGFPKYYNRKLAPVNVNGVEMVAWIYYMEGELEKPFVEGGDWTKFVGAIG